MEFPVKKKGKINKGRKHEQPYTWLKFRRQGMSPKQIRDRKVAVLDATSALVNLAEAKTLPAQS